MTKPRGAAPDITAMSDDELAEQMHARLFLPWPNPWNSLAESRKDDWRAVVRYVRTLIPPAPQPVARVPVAMTHDGADRTVICADGTVWHYVPNKWRELPPIPQPGAPTPSRAEVKLSEAVAADERALQDSAKQITKYGTNPARDAVMDALLAAVMDCGNLLSGIVAREDDAGDGAYLKGKQEHLRLLRMCDDALDLAREDGWT